MVDYALITLSQPRDAHASDDDDEDGAAGRRSSVGKGRSGGGGEPPSVGASGGASASSSSGKKPRGRPPGSKNKPKPPVVITKDSESAMHPMVLELSAGCDVLESVSAFARRRRIGVSVLSGSGAVANVSLRHPTSPSATVTLHGRFDILSLAGTFLPPLVSSSIAAAASAVVPRPSTTKPPFTISLAGSQGQVIGGTVAGALTAVGPVVLVAASFANPEFHRLPEAEEEEAREEDVKPVVEAAPVYGVAASNPSGGQPQYLSTHEMVLWATPSASRPPSHHHHNTHSPSHY